MAFCANCGSEMSGQFCPKCGNAAGGGATPPAGGGGGSAAAASTGLQENVAGALCYALGFITGVLFLVLAPYNQNPRIRFHAFQSILVNVAWIVVFIAMTVVTFILPFFLQVIWGLLSMLLWLGVFLLWLFLMWKAYSGEKVVLPVVGGMAEGMAAK